jgi:hypothetical protein
MLSGETRWGTKYGSDLILQDSLSGALVDHNVGHGEKTAMGSEWVTAHVERYAADER